jgi:hypothetical protein
MILMLRFMCRMIAMISYLYPSVSAASATAAYPYSTYITGITFDMSTLLNTAPGNAAQAPESDNWPITWADDGHQYTAFGDGKGFSTFDAVRASLGVARIEGGKNDYSAYDIFKTGSNSGGWGGKSLGIISIDGSLWMFRNGIGSNLGAFEQTELYESIDHGQTWTYAGVHWIEAELTSGKGFFAPAFLQFGQDYAGARDNYVYIYAPEHTAGIDGAGWQVQNPGKISLIRVPKDSLENQLAYEYFTGMAGPAPQWSSDVNARQPVFEDNVNGVMRNSISYNASLGRYILAVQQVSRYEVSDYHIGIYEAPEPWGPWTTVVLDNASIVGPDLNTDAKTVHWNFSNKWLSANGKNFTMVYTGAGRDEWGTVEGNFNVAINGDINADGSVDIRDLLLLQQTLVGSITLTPPQKLQADLYPADGDWILSASDLLRLEALVLAP